MKRITNLSDVFTLSQEELAETYFSTDEILFLYSMSPITLNNYRRGYYFAARKKSSKALRKTYKKWFFEDRSKLRHLPQRAVQRSRNGVLYKVAWVNDYLRRIGREAAIPPHLQNL